MNWIELKDYASQDIFAGCVIRVPTMKSYDGSWYADSVVDFLVFEAFGLVDDAGVGLIVMTGSKAGKINAIFPAASCSPGTFGLNKEWLMQNWKKFFYSDGDPEQAWIGELDAIEVLPDGDVWKIPA